MKICPNCGTHLKGNEVFCPNCGYDLSQHHQKTSQQTSKSDDQLNLDAYFDHLERSMVSDRTSQSEPNGSDQPFDYHDPFVNHNQSSSFNNHNEQSKRSMPKQSANIHEAGHSNSPVKTTNYFSWWWQTIRHPAKHLTGHWYFSLISFGISCLLWILAFHSLMGCFNSLINSFFGGRISVDNAMFESADQSWWGLIVIGLLAWFSYWLLGFGFSKLYYQLDFWQYGNQLAALTSLTLPLSLVMLILAELGLIPLAMFCFFVTVVVNVTGLVVSITIPNRSKLYLAMLVVGLIPLIVIVVFTCIVQIIG